MIHYEPAEAGTPKGAILTSALKTVVYPFCTRFTNPTICHHVVCDHNLKGKYWVGVDVLPQIINLTTCNDCGIMGL